MSSSTLVAGSRCKPDRFRAPRDSRAGRADSAVQCSVEARSAASQPASGGGGQILDFDRFREKVLKLELSEPHRVTRVWDFRLFRVF